MSRAADITEIDDLIASTSESPWLSVDSTSNDLDKPWGVALLPDGQLAIVERGPPQIRKVNPDDSAAAFSEIPLPPKCGGLAAAVAEEAGPVVLEELDADAEGPLEALDDIDHIHFFSTFCFDFDIVFRLGLVCRFLTLSP